MTPTATASRAPSTFITALRSTPELGGGSVGNGPISPAPGLSVTTGRSISRGSAVGMEVMSAGGVKALANARAMPTPPPATAAVTAAQAALWCSSRVGYASISSTPGVHAEPGRPHPRLRASFCTVFQSPSSSRSM